MVRETRHLWVGNLPDNIREERIKEYFKRYGRVQSVKLLPRVTTKEETGEITMACTVAFMDIKSASKAHNAELKIDDRTLNTEYYEPDAIPSAASPQYTPSPYSTSPSTTRFPNGHGSSDEHGTFPERFYDRTTTRVSSDSEFIRRTGYHETGRGRNRDRGYRNGPYNALSMDRHRPINNTWSSYDVSSSSSTSTTRYNSTTGSQTDTGYSTTPTDTTERRNSDQSCGNNKKKTKSRSGSGSPSPSGSTSSRSPSRSRSRSSSSSSSSSTSRATSSTSSPKSRRLTSTLSSSSSTTLMNSSSSSQQQQQQQQPPQQQLQQQQQQQPQPQQHQPVVHSDDRRPLAICVKNLPLRSSDTSLKDGLFHEYKKHGKVTWVKVVGQSSDRYAIVCFKKPEDVEKALEVSYDKLFFGCKIEVAPYVGYDVEDNDLRPYEAEIDEYHPKATRTLFIGNLEKDVTASDLRKHFDQFGEIIEIDIKKQGVVSSYAFCQYSDIVSVVKAIRKMDGEHLGNNRIKLGFGKSMPTNCVWVDGVGENCTEKYLRIHFEPFGVVSKLHVDRDKGQALIFYEQVVSAQSAVNKMRGFNLKNNKIQVDFASRECQEAFFEHLEKQGQLLDRNTFIEDSRRDSTSNRSFDSTTNRYSRYDTPTRPRTSSYSSRSSAATSQITSAIPSPGTPGSVTPRGTGSSRSRIRDYYYDQTGEYIGNSGSGGGGGVGGNVGCLGIVGTTTVPPDGRHFRNYDEYSQGSAASHEDGYDHEYQYSSHGSPNHLLDPLETRCSLQSVETTIPSFPPPDIRNLQKERVHLLEQLEECPSSGDELISPKKRLKLDLLDGALPTDVIIEANRDHRKVMEVRRMSDVTLKHYSSRRPSIDSSGKHASSRDALNHDRNYLPHGVCKRRKTTSSDSGSRIHHYDHSGSESVGGSRPGTPLCDERPESFQPTEPRRIPRERDLPLTLPLPRFATQVLTRGSISVAGIKGQKDNNILSSPPAAVTSPRISNPRPPSPIHEPPPASPPPRPPSLSSNSSDSDITPPSPSLEERIRSLDERYEKWSGSRALSAAGGDALAILDANLEKFRSRHKLLDLDLKEVQPSEIVKSVMAKRSVFDEDLKRLENVGEKYEPKEFCAFPRNVVATTATVAVAPPPTVTTTPPQQQQQQTTTSVPAITTTMSSTVVSTTQQATLKLASVSQLPKTPPTTMLSPRSTASLPAAKGLQYPFPSHPPTTPTPSSSTSSVTPQQQQPISTISLLTTVSSSLSSSTVTTLTTTATTPLLVTTSTTTTATTQQQQQQQIRSNHGDNRLKSCQIASNISDNIINRTSSKVNVNRTALVSSSLVSIKTSEKNNIPNASDNINACSSSDNNNKLININNNNNNKTTIATVIQQQQQQVRDVKSISSSSSSSIMVNNSEKILNSGSSEKVLCRRDSNGGSPRTPSSSSSSTTSSVAADVRSRRNSETTNPRRIEDTDKFNCNLIDPRTESEEQRKKDRLEKIRIENERMEREKVEKERIEKERIEKERQEKELLEKERLEKERLERESELEKQRLEKERLEKERIERERAEKEERDKRREEQEQQRQREREEKEKREREEREKREREEKEERERLEKEKQLERERKRDDERRHKEDNHRHRENHSENKHNHIEKTNIFEKNTKESINISEKINKEDNKHDSCKSSHEKSVRHHSDRDQERRKDSIKENRDNNIHDKHKNFNDIKENKEVRSTIESRHMSIEMDKSRSFENALLSKPQDLNKRKERNNSLPANIGSKRRLSSHESDNMDENKRIKLNQDHKKLSERRDSKDSTRSDKTKHKNNSISSSKTHDEKQRQKEKEREERHKNKQHKLDKQKAKSKSREKDSRESPSTPKSPLTDKDFLGRLELRSTTEDVDNNKQLQRKDSKDSKRDMERDEKKMEERKKEKQEKSNKQREESKSGSNNDERKTQQQQRKEQRIRKITQNSSDNTDSDEPKKHSIFDIVDDEPAYISMYDKVKARSCKNMQKQEEEKRQEKIKAKFSQLKQSRAKREEKKRSTSWDEDSDSDRERIDKSEIKMKRCPKIIASSDDEEMDRKVHKKKEIYTDSDSDRRQIKMENIETSDDDRVRTKNPSFKSSKSRITSDTSDDEFKKIQTQIKNEIYSDNEQNFADSEENKPFKVKDELDRLIKKERRNNKHQESITEQIFGDSNSPLPEKQHNNRLSFADNSTDDEMVKKERSESRKKHKKKQKRQKHSMSSEESCKLEMVIDSIQNECLSEKTKHHDKKKQHSKKDKKRDKSKDERDKTKKSKKNKSDSKSDLLKRDGKMENIFGSLSEDSESGMKESEDIKQNSYKFNDEGVQSSLYNSESDREVEHKIFNKHEDKEQRQKEEHKKHKEKKRREKERRLQEAAAVEINENSLDYADLGKQLEANIKDESTDIIEEMTIKTEVENNDTTTEEPFRFGHNNDGGDYRKDKESKEKKKKRKKSKEEKQKHHHHHHHDKNKVKSPEIKKPSLTEEIKIEIDEQKTQNQSLPNILDIPSPENTNKSSSTNLDYSISPIPHEPLISPIPKTPTSSKDKKRDKLIPGFGGDIDEKIHESAVKSISDFESSKEEVKVEETKPEKQTAPPPPEEKPRVIISQEETEDAVAALLGESFGENQFEDCYNEEITTNPDQTTNLTEENNVQDDEEMRQAVQSLSSTDLDVKPETPLSENELQIDTDTEEQDDISLRYDQPPKTPDMNDLLRPPKTPDLPSYMRNNEETNKSNNNVKTAVPNSPPSLTPIKPTTPPSPPPLVEVKKPTEPQEMPKSLPLLPEARSVISKSWSTEHKVQNDAPITTTSTPICAFNTPPMVKINEYPSPLSFSKQSPTPIEANKVPTMTVLQTFNKSPTNLHTLPARSPIQIKQQPSPIVTEAPKTTQINRLPITSVTVSKPLQPTTVILPQSKIAHSLEPPKLVSTLDPKPVQQQRMILQSTIQPNQFNYPNKSHLVQGLLIPSKVPPTSSYNYVPQTVPSLSVLVKDSSSSSSVVVSEKSITETTSTTTITTTAPTTVVSTPSIIISNSSNATQMPVIQEAPPAASKLIQFPSTTRPKNVIQQTPPTSTTIVVPEVVPAPPPQNESNDNLLKVENRTSTPSPVIVQNPKEQLNIVVEKKEEPTTTTATVEEPTKLAIATVTEELNLSLKKDDESNEEENEPLKDVKLEDVKTEIKEEPKTEPEEKVEPSETVSVIKETEKFDEEKADTESIVSDISKERSSADILTKDDALDNKEDSDYWSAKEVNIDSVIKTLCSADELSDHSSEIGKDEWFDDTTNQKSNVDVKVEEKDTKKEKKDDEIEIKQQQQQQPAEDIEQLEEGVDDEEKELSQRGGKRVSRGRGRKSRGSLSDRGGIQTRRGKLVKEPNNSTQTTTTTTTTTPKRGSGRGGRGGGGRGDRKSSKSESENSSTDVYEFRDDPDENNVNKERPRLILTIKSPAVTSATNNQTTAIVKEVIKDGCKEIVKEVKETVKEEPIPSPPVQQQQQQQQPQIIQQQTTTTTTKPVDNKEEFISPTVNTRKSKRLQERDGSRNTVDDTIEDVVRNTVQTRAAAAAAANNTNGPRRSGRQPVPKVQLQETPRKSPRGGGRKKDRRASECTDDSSEEKTKEIDVKQQQQPSPIVVETPKEVEDKKKEMEKEVVQQPPPPTPQPVVQQPTIKEKPHEGLKAAMLRRIKGEMNHEPTNLIDPVTGLLTPMRESEEGGYIPLPNERMMMAQKAAAETKQTSVIQQQQQQPNVVQQKPQSLKAHVLSSQAAKAVVQQHQQQQQQVQAKPTTIQTSMAPQTIIASKPVTPISQHLSVNVAMSLQQQQQPATHLSPRSQPLTVNTKPIVKVVSKQLSPTQLVVATQQQQQQQPVLQVCKPATAPSVVPPKAHISSQMPQQQTIVNTQMAHIKPAHQPVHKQQQPQQQQQQQQQVIRNMSKSPHSTKPQLILTGSVASPPLKAQSLTNPARIIQAPPTPLGGKVKEPPKVDVSLPNMILNQRTTLSPQGPASRHVGQAGLPPYEASLHGERSLYNRSRSPPPAHQNSPSPQGEAMAHFPPGSVPLRPPHNLPPPYMNVMPFQQFYYLSRNPMVPGGIEKTGDGQEGEEAPITSPPLELRRPGSVGLALTGRGAAVPHSLHSPHDRATDSPQVGQVFNVHSSRMPPHYHPNRYYEQTEPPPAHRPLTSHASLASLTNDRPPLSHMTPLSTPDRPLSGHLQAADRPLGPYPTLPTHLDRPLSTHSMIGSGLGAAGNLMGAVARHVGADAPASQRGLQAATPPHASQVPPQAESLFMLLKQYPCMWQGLLALKNDQAAVQMYFVSGNDQVAKCSLPKNIDNSTPPLRIFQRMRLEPPQVEGVARKMQMENEHCMLLALPCGLDHVDVLKQSTNLTNGFIKYLQQKQAAGIVNVAAPGTTQPPAYVVHIFPSCDFVNENLCRIAPSLLERVADIAHLLIVITTV